MSQLRFIRQNVYQLKQRYPGAIDIIRRTANTVDVSTGIKTVQLVGVHVNRAIVLPSAISRAALFDRTYVANDRDFVYGTNFDVTVRSFIIDHVDLPSTFGDPVIGDYIVYRGVRYNLQKVQSLEGFAFLCLAKETLSELPNLAINLNVYEDLGSILETVSYDTNFDPLEIVLGEPLFIVDRCNTQLENFVGDALLVKEIISLELITNSGNEDFILATNASGGYINIGMPVYSSGINAVQPGRANSVSTAYIVGLAVNPFVAPGDEGLFQLNGYLDALESQWDAVTGQVGGLTTGAPYYLDPNTAGMLTATAPSMMGQFIVQIGTAISSTRIDIDIQAPIGL
jgi:hypothetical protein